MALLKRAEFSKLCGMASNKLSVHVSRGKAIMDNDLFDTENEVNKAFIARQKTNNERREAKQIPRADTYRKPKNDYDFDDEGEDDENDLMSMTLSDKKYRHFLAERTQKGAELDDLKIQKLNGVLVPTDLVKHLMRHHSSSITKSFKETMEDVVTMWGAKYRISDEDMKQMRKTALDKINFGIDKAIAESKKGLAKLVDDFSMSRGKGERK